MQYYKQCTLMAGSENGGTIYQVVFIPIDLAKEGKIVTVEGDEKPWIVVQTGSICDEETLNSWRKQWKDFEMVLS